MKLETRLTISFLIMVILPVCLFGVISIGILKYNYYSIDRYYEIEGTDLDSITNPVKIYFRVSDKVFGEISRILEESPDKVSNKTFWLELSNNIKKKATGVAVEQDGELLFCSDNVNYQFFREDLDIYSTVGDLGTDNIYYKEEYHFIARYLAKEVDGKKYDIYLITYMDDLLHRMKKIIGQGITAIVIVLILTSAVLIRKIHDATIVPLNKLRAATVNIKEGNLEFQLEQPEDNGDVINGLFADFEAMRCKLRENADEKLRNDKENKELISNISHDLKTPITAIKGYAEGLVDGVAVTPQMQERYLRTIYNKSIEMDRLIDELTLYSKIDTNRIPYKFEKVSFVEFFNDCADSLRMELEAKNITFEYHNLTDGESTIIADVEQMSRVVNNIISNSVKYMNTTQGKIVMTLRDEGDFVRVELSDNGLGISKKDLPHIFDRFYRSDEARNSATGGSGIGLAIVKKIVEDHGGRIWAESREGQGTKMCIVIRKYLEV